MAITRKDSDEHQKSKAEDPGHHFAMAPTGLPSQGHHKLPPESQRGEKEEKPEIHDSTSATEHELSKNHDATGTTNSEAHRFSRVYPFRMLCRLPAASDLEDSTDLESLSSDFDQEQQSLCYKIFFIMPMLIYFAFLLFVALFVLASVLVLLYYLFFLILLGSFWLATKLGLPVFVLVPKPGATTEELESTLMNLPKGFWRMGVAHVGD